MKLIDKAMLLEENKGLTEEQVMTKHCPFFFDLAPESIGDNCNVIGPELAQKCVECWIKEAEEVPNASTSP